MTTAPDPDRLRAAIDAALAAGREAKGDLKRLEGLLVEARSGAERERRSWPLALFRMFGRGRQRRRIMALTRVVQAALTALDAAVDVVRGCGAQLAAPPASRRTRGQAPAARPVGRGSAATVWDGPLDLAVTTLQRVDATLDELRALRDAEPPPRG